MKGFEGGGAMPHKDDDALDPLQMAGETDLDVWGDHEELQQAARERLKKSLSNED